MILIVSSPPVSFRCAVTLSSVLGHTDCTGTVTIGGETLTFVGAGKKTTSTLLTSLPVITTTGLDCNILITCIDSAGKDIQTETDNTMAVDWEDATTYFPGAMGGFERSDSNCETDDFTAKFGDQLTHNGIKYTIKNIKTGERTLSGTNLTRILQF